MLSIIQRYLVVEILKSSIATTLILFIILMSNTLGRVLSDVSEGKTPVEAIFPVLLGQSIYMLNLLLPLGIFLGIIFALGRSYADHELVVLHACGFGYRKLYKAVFIVVVPALMVSTWLSLFLSADMQQRALRIVEENENIHEFQQLKVGQFNKSLNNNQVFFMQSMSEDRTEIYDIIITQKMKEKNVLETARTGRHKVDEVSGDLFLEVGPGIRYEGRAGNADYNVVEFDRHGILLKKKPARGIYLDSDEKYFSQIAGSTQHRDRVELLWRITIPVTLLILGLLAVPLAYIAPRQGRYGKIGWSILIFILYLNLLGMSKSALESASIPLWLNFWWIHLIFLIVTFVLLGKRNRTRILFWPGEKA